MNSETVGSLFQSGTGGDPASKWVETMGRLHESLSFEEAAEVAIDFLMELTGMASVVIYYSGLEEYYPLRLVGQKIIPDSPIPYAETLFSENTVAQESLKRRTVIVTQNSEDSPEYGARMLRRHTRTGVSIPLIAHNQAVGVMQLSDHRPYRFEERHLPQVTTLARHLALSMDTIALREREQRTKVRAEILQQIASVSLSSTEASDAINISLGLLEATLPFQKVFITLQPELFRSLPVTEETRMELFKPFERMPIASEVVNLWSSLHLPDTRRQPQWITTQIFHPTIRSYIGAPLLRTNRILGVLSIMSESPFAFQEGDPPFVQTVATYLADILEKSHIFRRMAHREKIADDLVLMGVALSTSLDEEQLLTLMCEQSATIFEVDGSSVWLVEGEQLRCVASNGIGSEALVGVVQDAVSEQFTAKVLASRRPIFLNHIRQANPRDPLWCDVVKARALLGVPFMHGNAPLGVLILMDTTTPDRFSQDDLEQLHLFGVQAALAIVNARLFAEARRRVDQLRLVNEIGRVATTNFLLQKIMANVTRALFKEFEYYAITLFLEIENRLNLYAIYLHDGSVQRAENYLLTLPKSTPYIAWQRTELAVNSTDRTFSMIFNNKPEHETGWYELSLPLIIAEDVIGVLNFERQTPISTDEQDVLESLASQMSFSVSNSRLFEIIQLQVADQDSRINQQTLALREQKEHIEAILQSVADAVITTDLEGRIISQNPAAVRFFSEAMRITKGLETLLGGIGDLVRSLLTSQKAEQTATLELGKLAVQAKVARVREGNHDAGTVIVLRDITPLREIDKLKSEFVSTVSHELRTPLSNIKLYLKLMETGKPEKRPAYQSILESETMRLERLIARLLDLTRLDHGLPQRSKWFNIIELIEENVQLNQALAQERGHQLSFDASENLSPSIFGDRDQIAQVLINLISNALNYTPNGGCIAVRCSENESSIRVEVEDNGIGVEKADMERIFDRFYRGRNLSENIMPGTGLGLSICKEIIALHRGSIGVESELGQGSIFWFTLPLVNEDEHGKS